MNKCLVILPVYNGDRFLKQTIVSVLSQTYTKYDFVIYDDFSSDNSVQTIKQFLNDKRIIFIQSDKNRGVGYAFHQLLKKGHHYKYIASIGQDDVWDKDFLQSQISYVNKNNVIVSFANVKYINDRNEEISYEMYKHDLIDNRSITDMILLLLSGNYFCASSSLINNRMLKQRNIINTTIYNDRLQDHELWLWLSALGQFGYNRSTGVLYRRHDNNLSNPNFRIKQNLMEYNNMIGKFINSSVFKEFICGLPTNSQNKFLISVASTLFYLKTTYGLPMLWITINFCEFFLENYDNDPTINHIYGSCLLESGLLSKYLEVSDYGKLFYCDFIVIKKEHKEIFSSTNLFEENEKIANEHNLKKLSIVYEYDRNIKLPQVIINDIDSPGDNICLNLSTKKDIKSQLVKYFEDINPVYGTNMFK